MVWVLIPPICRAVLSLFYPPVIIRGKNGKNSEKSVGSNKSEKRKPKSAVYRSFLASVVYFHFRLISTRRYEREMTRNQFAGNRTWVRIPPSPPARRKRHIACDELFPSRTKLIARSFCCFSLPKRNRLRWVALWGCRTAVLFYQGKNIDFNRPFQVGANVISFAPTSFYACGKRDVICPLSYANGFKSQGGS